MRPLDFNQHHYFDWIGCAFLAEDAPSRFSEDLVSAVQLRPANLEDVYLKLTGRELEDNE